MVPGARGSRGLIASRERLESTTRAGQAGYTHLTTITCSPEHTQALVAFWEMFGNSWNRGVIPSHVYYAQHPPRSEPRGQEEKERRRNTRWLDGGAARPRVGGAASGAG